MKSSGNPYDLSVMGRNRLLRRFERGYRPKSNRPYDLGAVYEQRLYHEWRRKNGK